jgi:opacity protein-like surface antigen
LKTIVLAFAVLAGSSCAAFSQADSTLSRPGDLQVGGGYTSANSDYVANRIAGFAFYSTFDIRKNLGVEVDFHQLNDPQPTQVYERTYEAGARYFRHYGIFTPYGKVLYGRGVLNYPDSQANLAYNMLVAGAGVDIAVHRNVNVRADFEYQDWFGFQPNGLTPSLITIGVAYHFGSGHLSMQQ